MTRQEWLTNNANIVLGEGGDDDEVFFNQIETRLKFVPEIQNEDDERLVDAYVNSLARYEAEGESATWAPRSVESLVAREGITAREAGVIAIMAAREYPDNETRKHIIAHFFKWLHENTDTFDPVMVRIALEDKNLGFNEKDQAEMIDLYLTGK